LANPGEEYLVLQPTEAAEPFSVTLDPGTYAVTWFSVGPRETVETGEATVEDSTVVSFSAPFEPGGPAALYLKRVV
jgi:hypothetical protein